MDSKDSRKVGLAYPLSQLRKSLATETEGKLKKFSKKPTQWEQVVEGMLSGELSIGSRSPIKKTPAWATPEVITGGFATGNLLAGGKSSKHEKKLIDRLKFKKGNQRAFINAYYLSDEGVSELTDLLKTKQYLISTPEEGALLVIAWLINHGYYKESSQLINTIAPHFETLRFFPISTQKTESLKNHVFLQTVADSVKSLKKIKPNKKVIQQKTTLYIWNPFYDKLVKHLLDLFTHRIPQKSNFTHPSITWKKTGQDLILEFSKLKKKHGISKRLIKNGSQFSKLIENLERLIEEKEPYLTHYLCQALERYITKRGMPGTEIHKAHRELEQKTARGSIHFDIANIIISRLEKTPQQEGLLNYESFCTAITKQEENSTVPIDTKIPRSLVKKVGRCQTNTIEKLLEQGYISSSDSMAKVLPQITSELSAASIEDDSLRHLYSSLYQAFRKRRSLLLLNYQNQIQLKEIPWISTIESFKNNDDKSTLLSKKILEEICSLAIINFPQAIIPNKLLQEIKTLADNAKLSLPIVDEIAADIFMGGFTPKFAHSAHIAGLLLKGSLYSRYYNIDYEVLTKHSPNFSQHDADRFSKYCKKLARDKGTRWSVASNGLIIEQQQIITTQNLAAIFHSLDLTMLSNDELLTIAKSCFKWICHRQQIKLTNYHAQLVMIKKTAYAWRQMLFFLSLLEDKNLNIYLNWMNEYFYQQAESFVSRFQYIIDGLIDVAQGKPITKESRFLGWTLGKHPLLASDKINDLRHH